MPTDLGFHSMSEERRIIEVLKTRPTKWLMDKLVATDNPSLRAAIQKVLNDRSKG